MDRKTELEQKKAKLDQLRQQKLQRNSNITKTPSASQLPTNEQQVTPSILNDIDPDKILIECGITTPTLTTTNSIASISPKQQSQTKQSFAKK